MYKSSNISEMRQDSTKVTTEVIYALSIGAKINDLQWSLCNLFQNKCFFRSSPWTFEWRKIYTVSDQDVAQWLYSVSQKKSPPRGPDFFHFFHKRLRICNRFFTHLLNVPIFARLQIFIQLSPILTKLCHIKRDYPVHIICAKSPKRAKTRTFRRLRKSLIALLIVVGGKSL